MEWIELKSGWLYERKAGLVLKNRWTPRWVVIYGEPVPALGIYEQRSDSIPPYAPLKHLDLPKETVIGVSDQRRKSVIEWIKKTTNNSTVKKSSNISMPEALKDENCEFWISRPSGGKIFMMARNNKERDEWVGALNGVLKIGEIQNATEVGENDGTIFEQNDKVKIDCDLEAISCAGVIVLEGSTVSKIKAGAVSCNPLILSKSSSDDSIVGDFTKSMAPINEEDEIDDINWKYQQIIIERDKTLGDLKLDLQILKLYGKFNSLVSSKLKQIVDQNHPNNGKGNLLQNRWEEGPLRILFVVDYQQTDEEIIAGAYAWLRQEIQASRWIEGKTGIGLLQQMITVVEYKGFRALAMLALPLTGNGATNSLIMEAESGLIDEVALNSLKQAATKMNLLPCFPFKLQDGRLIQLSMSPTIEVHRLNDSRGNKNNLKEKSSKSSFSKTPAGLYLTNLHDIMPSIPITEEFRGLLFFRREVIETLPTPIAPGDMHLESRQSILKVLLEKKLPSLVEKLEGLEILPLDSEEWKVILHEAGINMAFLGVIASMTKLPHVREGAIIEMISRTAKLMLKGRLRNAILNSRDAKGLSDAKFIILDLVNRILECDEVCLTELLPAIEDRFNFKITFDEMRHVPRNSLLMALSHHCNFKLKDSAYLPNHNVIKEEDFGGFLIRVLHGGFIPTISGAQLEQEIVDMARIMLPLGETLWDMELSRANSSHKLLKVIELKVKKEEWEDALNLIELARGLCPKHHPLQVLILLAETTVKVLGPANLAWRRPVLGEKPIVGDGLDELKRTKSILLNKLDRALGTNHPLAIDVRVGLSRVMEAKDHKLEGLSLRSEALNIAYKVLGRRHKIAKNLLLDLARSNFLAEKFDKSIECYTEALGLFEDSTKQKSNINYEISKCWQSKGDYEAALEWVKNSLELSSPSSIEQKEKSYELLGELSLQIYKGERDIKEDLSILTSDEMLAPPIIKHLQVALDCYCHLFDIRRHRQEIEGPAGISLILLVRRIVLLIMRLAAPTCPAIKTNARKRMFVRDPEREEKVKEVLVRMVAGEGPKEMVERVLEKVAKVETLSEAEPELAVLLDLIELVN